MSALLVVQQPAGHTLLLPCSLEQHSMGSAPCLHIATCYTDCLPPAIGWEPTHSLCRPRGAALLCVLNSWRLQCPPPVCPPLLACPYCQLSLHCCSQSQPHPPAALLFPLLRRCESACKWVTGQLLPPELLIIEDLSKDLR